MRILIVHNAYQQRGGEDSVVESEMAMLRECGNEVASYSRHNDEIAGMSRFALAGQTVWSARTEADIAQRVADFRPDVIHVHNTFPLISPSLYRAADRAGVPVVQTLHNFRLLCPQAMFLRDGKVCEDCLGRPPWRGVARACYRGSPVQSAVLGGMLMLHGTMGTYRTRVTRYIALNEFCRRKFIDGGLPEDRMAVKPNFIDFPCPPAGARSGFLFVGRLSAEKGVSVLARAMAMVPGAALRVAGSGPEADSLNEVPGIVALGAIATDVVRDEMSRATALVMPSIWYENFPRTLVEAFACGLPVIASRLGAMAELIEEGRTGLLFEPGSSGDLARKLAWAQANSAAMEEMGKCARREYEEKYTPGRNYEQLMAIYAEAIAEKRRQCS